MNELLGAIAQRLDHHSVGLQKARQKLLSYKWHADTGLNLFARGAKYDVTVAGNFVDELCVLQVGELYFWLIPIS